MIKPSPTLELAQRIAKANERGETAYSFSTPTFTDPIRQPVLNQPMSFALTPAAGLPELRELAWVHLFDKWTLPGTDLLITAGAKAACFSALKALTSPGATALIIGPAWPSYEDICRSAGLHPTLHETTFEDAFGIDELLLHKSLGQTKAKVIILSNPNNPCGRIYTRNELALLRNAAEQHGCWLILDESFSHVTFDQAAWQSSVTPASDRLIIINSFSKNFHMQGLRLGALVAPRKIAGDALAVHQSIISSAASVSQQIAVSMLRSGEKLGEDYSEQVRLAREFADAMRWQYVPTVGTFYLFPRLPDVARFRALAAERNVYLLSGDFFGPSYGDHVRFCFGKPMEELRAMLDCLADIAVAA